ncbi:unnamed protein product [Ranitomeya imitator]|uniref:Uncharacterized protein n=1 Tax=Ranitomeya imitator TaxID=111125 RepID=A0ABN9LTJ8_9NEOB|nr:unnamed protein product [Ranitomeya imitator]
MFRIVLYVFVFRVCGISEGLYTFQTHQGQHIYERVHTAVLALAEQHKSLLPRHGKELQTSTQGGRERASPQEPAPPCCPAAPTGTTSPAATAAQSLPAADLTVEEILIPSQGGHFLGNCPRPPHSDQTCLHVAFQDYGDKGWHAATGGGQVEKKQFCTINVKLNCLLYCGSIQRHKDPK